MTEQLIDLTKIHFWLVGLLGVIALAPLTAGSARKYVWAALNLTFIASILGWEAGSIVIALPVVYFLLRSVAGSGRILSTALCVLSIVALFLIHKLSPVSDRMGLTTTSEILSIIGFSYIALRVVDLLRAVFEGKHPPPDLVSLINYLIPFHMLAAGPIQAYEEFVAQPEVPPRLSRTEMLEAIERIATGLFKKFVLAYLIQKVFLTDFEADGIYFFIEVQFFFLWLYLDFSAYSDIAVGVGRLLGIATPENFDRPYLARNMIDFWNRWHISLSMFIRRNIFIPLQLQLTRRTEGHRPLLVASIAFTISFALCGLWHGLSINFLLWGLIHAFGLVVATLWRHFLKKKLGTAGVKTYLENRKILLLSRILTYEFVAFSLAVLFYP